MYWLKKTNPDSNVHYKKNMYKVNIKFQFLNTGFECGWPIDNTNCSILIRLTFDMWNDDAAYI